MNKWPKLNTLNWASFWAHFLQGIGAILTTLYLENAKNFKVPLQTHYAKWVEDVGPTNDTQSVALVPFAAVTCAVPFLSAIAHLCMALSGYDETKSPQSSYTQRILNLKNPYRWLEYAISSTLMFFLICLLFSLYDLLLLVVLMLINVTVMWCGYLMEKYNTKETLKYGVDWTPFHFGCFLAVAQWAIVWSTVFRTIEMPALIWAVIGTYFVLFMTFAINMGCFYRRCRNGKAALVDSFLDSYLTSERWYMVLSLVSKSLLLWLVLFGVNQPSPYTTTQ
jgi:hypothetical protein